MLVPEDAEKADKVTINWLVALILKFGGPEHEIELTEAEWLAPTIKVGDKTLWMVDHGVKANGKYSIHLTHVGSPIPGLPVLNGRK